MFGTECVCSAAEVQGEDTHSHVPAGAHIQDTGPNESLQDIDFDDGTVAYALYCLSRGSLFTSTEDQTNIHRHARRNAQEAIALARRRAQDFDTQAALERKTNEALKLAKGQAHIRDDGERASASGASGTPLVDRASRSY